MSVQQFMCVRVFAVCGSSLKEQQQQQQPKKKKDQFFSTRNHLRLSSFSFNRFDPLFITSKVVYASFDFFYSEFRRRYSAWLIHKFKFKIKKNINNF